ncbi:hypothetical protein [Paenibacillus planticolens]|uniref:hypothetical protein n=1 Tax=Paenibacillus planticolens TaxID=2654976 RepID=UPI00149110F7|nr:hypothetical protein [Paenibacillus planticolens]
MNDNSGSLRLYFQRTYLRGDAAGQLSDGDRLLWYARTSGVPSGEHPGAGVIRASGGPLHEIAHRELLDKR